MIYQLPGCAFNQGYVARHLAEHYYAAVRLPMRENEGELVALRSEIGQRQGRQLAQLRGQFGARPCSLAEASPHFRALVGSPPIIVLDEPTSSVDTDTEARLMENLRHEFAGRTLILITHRPSLLRVVDRVILLSRGRVAMDGTPDSITNTVRQIVTRPRGTDHAAA